MPLTFHRTFGGKPADADWDELVSQNITAGGTVYRFFSAVRPFTYMVLGGMFVRHPQLRIVAAEVNFGWLPFWAQTMEQNVDVRSAMDDPTVASTLRPTEHLGRNLFVTVLDDQIGFDLVAAHPYLADTAMFSSDYPHSVTLWPNSRQHATTLTANLPRRCRDEDPRRATPRAFTECELCTEWVTVRGHATGGLMGTKQCGHLGPLRSLHVMSRPAGPPSRPAADVTRSRRGTRSRGLQAPLLGPARFRQTLFADK